MSTSVIESLIRERIEEGKKLFAWLIDPDKETPAEFESKLLSIKEFESGIDLLFLGGSLLSADMISGYIETIKNHLSKPIVLFPGGINQINSGADGILLLSLISGRNPDFLIGRHVEAAAILKASKLEILSTGYMLVDSGLPTTASYVSNTTPIPSNKTDIAVNTALAGEQLGLHFIFMDGGSGALIPVSEEMISAVKSQISVPLIVGGGIRTPEQIKKTYEAGADIVVVGNVLEKDLNLLKEFLSVKESMSKI